MGHTHICEAFGVALRTGNGWTEALEEAACFAVGGDPFGAIRSLRASAGGERCPAIGPPHPLVIAVERLDEGMSAHQRERLEAEGGAWELREATGNRVMAQRVRTRREELRVTPVR